MPLGWPALPPICQTLLLVCWRFKSAQYFFLLSSGKVRDCAFWFRQDGAQFTFFISSSGYIYWQPLSQESSARHGPESKDSNGQTGWRFCLLFPLSSVMPKRKLLWLRWRKTVKMSCNYGRFTRFTLRLKAALLLVEEEVPWNWERHHQVGARLCSLLDLISRFANVPKSRDTW
jgi:hypothetical protein